MHTPFLITIFAVPALISLRSFSRASFQAACISVICQFAPFDFLPLTVTAVAVASAPPAAAGVPLIVNVAEAPSVFAMLVIYTTPEPLSVQPFVSIEEIVFVTVFLIEAAVWSADVMLADLT